ncbi:MAG TPA: hypothetical protein VK754_09815 [Propionibacteriaceae bacterium]|nr:hypothetical protein [Propionibacteriaceae bacterium]
MARDSKRDRIRQDAEQLLRRVGKPLHNTEIAGAILPALGLVGVMSPKDVNTCLHDDSHHRFHRVSKGTWALAITPRSS